LVHTAGVVAEEMSRLWREVEPNHPMARASAWEGL
jgi:hypothetical protein